MAETNFLRFNDAQALWKFVFSFDVNEEVYACTWTDLIMTPNSGIHETATTKRQSC